MELMLKDIHKSFGEKQVLKGISFTARSGKAFGLLGRNGAGKTTTIRILMDVFPADSGEVLLDGSAIDYSRTGLGYLPEERGLYPKKKVIDQLVYFAELKGCKKLDTIVIEMGDVDTYNAVLDQLINNGYPVHFSYKW